MNRLHRFDWSDESIDKGYRVAAATRYVAGCLVIGCMLLASALTGCQPALSKRALNATVDQAASPRTSDGSLDDQLRLDPSEILFYSSNVHG